METFNWPHKSKFKLVTEVEVGRKRTCSECGKKNLVVSYEVRSDNGKVHKVVCSRECIEKFDDRFWSSRADKREKR